jgi:putative NADPH-quinone reductase
VGKRLRVHVIFAHPVETSFNAAVHRTAIDALAKAGHEIDDLDLYAEGFEPVLSRQERLDYHDLSENRKPVGDYVDRLMRAEALVLCAPVWNYGWPAIMKGWFDRVWLPGVSFRLVNDGFVPNLQHIRSVTTLTHYGGGRLRSWLAGDPPRKLGERMMRALIHPAGRVNYLALYGMDASTQAQREAFLVKVERRMRDL